MWPGRGKKKDASWDYLPVERLCARQEDPPQDLCASVAATGLIQPLIVVPHGEDYVVLEGTRRFHAARRAGMARVPAVIVDLTPETAAELRRWHPELAAVEPVATGRVMALLEEARRRGIVDGGQVTRLRTKAEGEVIATLTEIWRAKKAGGVATIGTGEPESSESPHDAPEEPQAAEVESSQAAQPSPHVEKKAGEPVRRGKTADDRQAVERLEQLFASIAVRGRVNGSEAERVVQLILKQRQSDPHAFLDWRNALPLDPLARNAMLVAKMSLHMALSLKWTRLQVLRMGVAGLLHNVGLVAQGWKPGMGETEGAGALEPITHVDAGARLIQEARTWGFQVQSVCLDHHERWNGSGEPRHKTREEVDLPTRMVALFDTFALLVNPWRGEGSAPHEAYVRLEAMAGTEQLFDPAVFRAFTMHFSKFPVGSVLRLPGGEIARVVGANPSDPTRPRVRILEPDTQRDRFTDLEVRDDACEDLSLKWEAAS